MPLYLYFCDDCGRAFEKRAMVAEAEVEAECPGCQGNNVTRKIGLPARPRTAPGQPATNCRGDGPPCGALWCGRSTN